MKRCDDEAATVAATMADPVQRIEIVSDRRARHDASFRARVVSDCLMPGAKVQEVARRHLVCPSLVYRWRRMAKAPSEMPAPGFLPALITERSSAELPAPAAPRRAMGLIEIELSCGTRVRVEETVGQAALRRVLGALRG